MSYRAVLFDLDGTLLNTLDDLADATNRMLAARGWPTHPVEAYRHFIGNGAATLVRRAVPEAHRDDATLTECLDAFRADYAKNWNAKTRPYDGAAEMLDTLTRRGVKLTVLSNKPDDFTKLCVKEFLPQWSFERVFGQRDGFAPKPDPTGAVEIAESLGVPPSEFLYLGDSGVDMTTATRAGMFPVGALWGFRSAEELREAGAKELIEHPMEFVELLDRRKGAP